LKTIEPLKSIPFLPFLFFFFLCDAKGFFATVIFSPGETSASVCLFVVPEASLQPASVGGTRSATPSRREGEPLGARDSLHARARLAASLAAALAPAPDAGLSLRDPSPPSGSSVVRRLDNDPP